MAAPDDDFRIATLPDKKWLYEQNLTLLNIFFDWRDRLLRLGLGGASALIAVATFSYGRGGPANGIVPAALAAIGSAVSLSIVFVNRRFAAIMNAAYRVGRQLETEFQVRTGDAAAGDAGHRGRTPFEELLNPSRVTFTHVITALATFIAVVCLAVAIHLVVAGSK